MNDDKPVILKVRMLRSRHSMKSYSLTATTKGSKGLAGSVEKRI